MRVTLHDMRPEFFLFLRFQDMKCALPLKLTLEYTLWYIYRADRVDLGGLGVTCSPRDQRLAGSYPAEVDGFFRDVKILSTSSPGGTLNWGSHV